MIAASAGNHAQGVSLSAKRLGLRAVIVMPKTTPEIKIDAVRNLDSEVVLAGDHHMVNIADNLRTGTPILFRDGFADKVADRVVFLLGSEKRKTTPSAPAKNVTNGVKASGIPLLAKRTRRGGRGINETVRSIL